MESLPSNPIAISVVVPVKNEEDSIRVLLERLLAQTVPPSEIVITDGGSIDKTREIIEEFIRRGAPVHLFREAFALPGRSRNIATANARHEWIAFIDAGNRPEPDWLENLVARTEDGQQADVVYGTYEPVINTFFGECAAVAYVPPPGNERARPHSIVSALMRRDVWQSVGGFPEDLRSAEDLLFIRKVEQAGFRIARAPGAIVHWNLQPNLWRTFKRFIVYARHNIRAGLWREWQLAIFLRYGAISLLAIPAVVVGWRWLVAPAGVWLGMMISRAMKSIYQNRISYPAGVARNLARLCVIMVILAAIDLAAFAGSVDWLVRDKLRRSKSNS